MAFCRNLTSQSFPFYSSGVIAGMYGGIQANPNQFQSNFLADVDSIETR